MSDPFGLVRWHQQILFDLEKKLNSLDRRTELYDDLTELSRVALIGAVFGRLTSKASQITHPPHKNIKIAPVVLRDYEDALLEVAAEAVHALEHSRGLHKREQPSNLKMYIDGDLARPFTIKPIVFEIPTVNHPDAGPALKTWNVECTFIYGVNFDPSRMYRLGFVYDGQLRVGDAICVQCLQVSEDTRTGQPNKRHTAVTFQGTGALL